MYIFQTKRKSGLGEEAAKIANNILNRSSASPTTKKGGKEKDDAKGKDVKKGVRNLYRNNSRRNKVRI